MAVSYKKLWKLLIDRDMKKKDLCAAAGISHASVAKLGKNENVTTDVLVKICTALKCDISDIMEIIEIEGEKAGVLTVNGHEIKINVGQNLTIDTNLMITYRQDRTLQNTAITGNYEDMYLLPGENTIEITEGLNLMVTPNWRVL